MSALRIVVLLTIVTAVLTWVIQWGILGVLFPQWGDGHGLLKGHDASGFNQVAMAQAAMIAEQGWSAWQLRPNGWGVSGILSAWYAMTWSSPAAFIPVQALLYGLAGGCLFVIFRTITGQQHLAVWGLLPLFFPTSAVIYAQPHRDIFIFFGFMLVLFAWLQWVLMITGCRSALFVRWVAAGSALLIGYLAVWSVRPYAAEILLAINLALVVLAMLIAALRMMQKGAIELPAVAAIGGALVAVVLTLQVEPNQSFDQIYVTQRVGAKPTADVDHSAVIAREAALSQQWQTSAWLASGIDDQFRRLSTARDSFAIENHFARSAIDLDRRFGNVGDVIAYTPRALSIGVLAPFPSQWRPQPAAPTNRNVERVLAGVEMAFFYLLLPFLALAIYQWRRSTPLWFVLIPAMAWLMVYSYTVPVVGALVRYRFPAYMIILGLAIMMLITFISRRRISADQVRRTP